MLVSVLASIELRKPAGKSANGPSHATRLTASAIKLFLVPKAHAINFIDCGDSCSDSIGCYCSCNGNTYYVSGGGYCQ